MSTKEDNLKEKFKQALNSTVKVISEEYKITDKKDQIKDKEETDYFQIENLNSKNDFIKARAEADTSALKKSFQIVKYIKKICQLIAHVSLFIQLQKKLGMSL